MAKEHIQDVIIIISVLVRVRPSRCWIFCTMQIVYTPLLLIVKTSKGYANLFECFISLWSSILIRMELQSQLLVCFF